MRLSLVLVLALACLAAAGPHGGDDSRARRSIGWGWDRADSFFHNIAAEARRIWAASTRWVKHLVARLRHHPEDATVYRLRVPHGSGVVAIIKSHGQSNGHHHHHQHGALVWDGKKLAWQHAGHGGSGAASDGTIHLVHAHVNKTLQLSELAKYLSHVPAGSRITVEIRGSSWHNLRVVLHVHGKHGENKKKSVSVLLSKLIKEEIKHHKEEIKHHKGQSGHSESTHSKKAAKKAAKKAPKLRWDGHDLVWAESNGRGNGKHVRHQLRITQNGEDQVIPFPVLAQHLKTLPANSEISYSIAGHTLKDLHLLLHVLGEKKQTISLPLSKLIQETEAIKHGASVNKPGKVLAQLELKHNKRGHKKGPTPTAAPQQV